MGKIGVALCITELEVGGAERSLVELAVRVNRERFTPSVYALGPPPEGDRLLVETLQSAGVPTHFLGARGKRDAWRTYRRLKRLLGQQRPQVAQGFLHHANMLVRFAARAAGVPRVLCGVRVAERRSRWPLRLDQWTQSRVDRYVCVSESVARFCREEAGLAADKLVVIPNGVALDHYLGVSPADLAGCGIPPERRLVGCIGRLEPQKGLDWLLRSAPGWLGELSNVDLLMVGQGPQRAELERLARAQGIERRVHWLGFRRDVPQILARCALLVLPSRWEGMPNVVLEAMASGLPVVATRVEGIRELLGSNADLQCVAPDDSQGFSRQVVRVMSHQRLAERLGRANRDRVAKRFTLARTVAAWEDLWQSLFERGAEAP